MTYLEKFKEVSGTYGGSQTECMVYVFEDWYAVEDSVNVNRAMDTDSLVDGVDVETVADCDTFTASKPIESAEDIERELGYE